MKETTLKREVMRYKAVTEQHLRVAKEMLASPVEAWVGMSEKQRNSFLESVKNDVRKFEADLARMQEMIEKDP